MYIYLIVATLLLAMELVYFKVAEKLNIIDKPNARSSHSLVVLRGGGIIFLLGTWMWSAFFGFQYPWFLLAISLVAGVSFIDDIRSLPDSVRLIAHFVAMALMFYQIGILQWELWWVVLIGLIVCVGAINIFNFMDGINGITAGYGMAVAVPLVLLNREMNFVEQSFLIVTILSLSVFGVFNFRGRGRAKCFAGDVGSIGLAFIILFIIGRLIIQTGDVTWLVLIVVYGVDGCLTICHRILLQENLGEAHRKHVYQLMANELKINHPIVSLIYMGIQAIISLCFIFVCPSTIFSHWFFLIGVICLLGITYVLFMKKYYYLHEEYLKTL